jgi:transcriptional regulator with XRE-family HTH domain
MSTLFRDKKSPCADIPCGKRFVVQVGHENETLADFVLRVRNEKGLSLEDVSERAGGLIGKSHINRIETGASPNPSPQKLQALAAGLGVSEEELFTLVRGKNSSNDLSLEELRLLHCFRGIPSERKADALGYLDMLYTRYGTNEKQGNHPEQTGGARLIENLNDPSLDKGAAHPVDPSAYGINGASLPDDAAQVSPESKEKRRRSAR